MTTETLLLVGRDAGDTRDVLACHAERLVRRTAVDGVEVAAYCDEPTADLRDRLGSMTADRVYAVPLSVAHTHDTVDRIPRALSYVPGEVRYCEPPGRSPAVTDAILDRAGDALLAAEGVSLVLVGFGSSSKPYHRRTLDYHARRLREGSDYGEVVTCYLIQNPTVECVRYNVSKPRTVAVPLFVSRTEATERRVPEKLELSRGGVEYTAPLGRHPRVTDAIHAEVEKQRALAADGAAESDTTRGLAVHTLPAIATDGEGGSL